MRVRMGALLPFCFHKIFTDRWLHPFPIYYLPVKSRNQNVLLNLHFRIYSRHISKYIPDTLKSIFQTHFEIYSRHPSKYIPNTFQNYFQTHFKIYSEVWSWESLKQMMPPLIDCRPAFEKLQTLVKVKMYFYFKSQDVFITAETNTVYFMLVVVCIWNI